jgi:hypothetical protein
MFMASSTSATSTGWSSLRLVRSIRAGAEATTERVVRESPSSRPSSRLQARAKV